MRLGGELALVPASANWFPPEYFYVYLQAAAFRAVEVRRWLGVIMNMDGSAYIDALGYIREEVRSKQAPTLQVCSVPLLKGLTFYTRYGDIFGGLCLIVAMIFGAAGVLRKRRGIRRMGRHA